MSCLTAKCPPEVPLALCHMPSLKKFNSRRRKRDLRFAVTITFMTSNKNSPVYIRCWKCCPPGRMHSLQLRKTFILWSSLEMLKSRVGCFWVLPGCVLAAGSCSFKVGTTTLLYGRSCNNFVALRADVSKHSSSGLGNFLRHISNRAVLKTDLVQQCTWVQTCCYSTEKQKCIYQQKTQRFIVRVCYRQQPKLRPRSKTVRDSLYGREMGAVFGPTFPWWNTFWLSFMEKSGSKSV